MPWLKLVRQAIPVRLQTDENELLRKVASYCSRAVHSARETEDAELVGFTMQIVKKRSLSSRAALASTIAHRFEALKQAEEEAPPPRSEIRELQLDLQLDETAAERTAARVVRSAIPKEEKRRKTEISALNGIRRLLNKIKHTDQGHKTDFNKCVDDILFRSKGPAVMREKNPMTNSRSTGTIANSSTIFQLIAQTSR